MPLPFPSTQMLRLGGSVLYSAWHSSLGEQLVRLSCFNIVTAPEHHYFSGSEGHLSRRLSGYVVKIATWNAPGCTTCKMCKSKPKFTLLPVHPRADLRFDKPVVPLEASMVSF